VIFTAHGWAFNEDRPGWQKLVIAYLHWLTVMLSHQTIAVSRAMVEQMKWPLATRKMTVINPGRTVPEFQGRLQARTTLTLAHPALNDYVADVWLMIVGELHPIKQHQCLFAALEQLLDDYPRVRLLCIGDGELRSQLDEYITEHNLADNVFLVGHLSEAATILKAADLFVLPSLSESYGYVVHEAGLAEVPIIASKVGGITDIISDDSEGTLITPTNPAELTEALRSFLDHPHQYSDQAQRLHAKLRDRTVQAMTTATAVLYKA
jgi:glycosyltransferase involved in cell wall biosynthesis